MRKAITTWGRDWKAPLSSVEYNPTFAILTVDMESRTATDYGRDVKVGDYLQLKDYFSEVPALVVVKSIEHRDAKGRFADGFGKNLWFTATFSSLTWGKNGTLIELA